MQKIFSQELRFKREDGTDYPEWERLELIDVLDYKQPTKYIVDSTEYSNDYETPVLTAGKSFILGYTDEEHNHFTNFPVVIFDDFTTDFKYVDFAFKVKSSAMKILIPRENVNVRFVYDAMKTIRFPKGEHKRYWISEYGFMKIPYPSEEEQHRIASLSVKFDQKIDVVDRELSSIRKLKKGLLQQMFV
jgi:type I restriction enzyme S subunit